MTRLLNNNRRKAAVFLLILFIVFSIMSYKQEADAIAPVLGAVAVVGVALVAYVLIVGGISFASTGDFNSAASACYNNLKPAIDSIVSAGKLVWVIEENKFKWVCDTSTIWPDIKAWIDVNYNTGDITVAGDPTILPTQTYGILPLVMDGYETPNAVKPTRRIHNNGSIVKVNSVSATTGIESDITAVDIPGGIAYYTYDNTTLILNIRGLLGGTYSGGMNITTWTWKVVSSIITGHAAEGIVDNPAYDWNNTNTGMKEIGVPLENDTVGQADITAPSGSDTIGLSVPGTIIADSIPLTPENIKTQVNTGVEVTGTIEGTITDTLPVDVKPTTEQENSIKAIVITKFPFCLPWDLVNAIKLIAHVPESPKFDIDLLAPIGGQWAGKARIVFDAEDYAIVGQVIRWASTVEFCWMLILATRKLIWG